VVLEPIGRASCLEGVCREVGLARLKADARRHFRSGWFAGTAARSVELLGTAKASNFEQTIACVPAVLVVTGGLRCPDLSNATRHYCAWWRCTVRRGVNRKSYQLTRATSSFAARN
jgi:hypothetical protein